MARLKVKDDSCCASREAGGIVLRSISQASEGFRAAMAAAGIIWNGQIVADGKLRRFKAEGDHGRNSWYVLHAGPPAAAAFGCWKRDIKQTWCDRKASLSSLELELIRQRWEEASAKLKAETVARQTKARKVAPWILNRSRPARTLHRYLYRKRVKVFGNLRTYRRSLVLPLRDSSSELHSLQFIGADGLKKFLTGGRIAGCFFTLADKADGPLVICEGYATGASAHEATGHAVICAMNSGNLLEVAKAAQKLWPQREIIIAADNDQFRDGNPGLTKATAAAKAIRAKLAVPQFKDIANKPTDFNDLAMAEGLDAVREQVGSAQVPREIASENSPQTGDVTDEKTSARLASEDITARLNSDLPKVQLPGDGRLLSAFATDCGKILKDCRIYQRGGVAFIVNQQRNGLDVITGPMLRTLAERHLVCFRVRCRDGDFVSLPRTMSTEDALGVLAAQQFLTRLPNVARIATARLPVMRKNGVIELLRSGYDRESPTLTLPQCDYDVKLPLSVAKEVIDELLAEFPFADDGRSKAVAVSAMVGLYAVGLLPSGALRPVFIYLANAEGAGKTLLAKSAISPTHGLVKTDGDLKDKSETAKELLAAVIEARPYILFDNCKRHLDSPYLEAFVSSTMWSGRILGVSKMFAGENLMTVFVTGNGCTVSPDMRRRALFVELFVENERPEDRKFQRILDDAVLLDLRPRILAALWALVREWDAAGRPKPSGTHTAFPRWAEIIGGIVEFAGYGCPLATAEIPSAADVDGADMREVVKLLADREPLKFNDLVGLSREYGLFERIIGSPDDGDLKPPDKSTLGKLLKRYDRRVFRGGRSFVIDGKGRYRTFRVEAISTGR